MSNEANPVSTGAGPKKKRVKKRVPAAVPAEETSASAPATPVKVGGHKFNFEEKQQIDFIREATKKNIWYYRDRMSVPRGPCSLPVLKECWVHGIIDEHTLVWGQGLADWLPVRNVRTLVPQIRTLEVQAAAWVKRTFALKPALERMRKQRGEQRHLETPQVEAMY